MTAVPMPQVEGVSHRDVHARGLRFHVAEAGPADGPPVVLLHGWPQHWFMWRDVIPASRRRPSRDRARPARARLERRAEVRLPEAGARGRRARAADASSGVERFDLIGHDWGAYAGFLICLTAPERVRPLRRLLDPAPVAAAGAPEPQTAADAVVPGRARRPRARRRPDAPGRASRDRCCRSARSHGRYTDDELAAFVDVLREPGARATRRSQYYRTFLLHELRPLISGAMKERTLTTPTRLLWGRRDQILQGAHASGDHERYAPNMTIEWVDDTGHFLPEERPELVVQRARELFGS